MRLVNRIKKLEHKKGNVEYFWRNSDETEVEMMKRYQIETLPDNAVVIQWSN